MRHFVLAFVLGLGILWGYAEERKSSEPVIQISLKHGEEQLDKFLKDRPVLQSMVRTGNPLWIWLRDRFGRSYDGIPVIWEDKPTAAFNPFGGECRFEIDKTVIRINKYYTNGRFAGTEIPAEEMLISIVFELNNAKNRSDFIMINDMAAWGKMSKRDYALIAALDEYEASCATGKFYKEVYLPYCNSNNLKIVPILWSTYGIDNFDKWLESFPPESGYPWQSYGKQYDTVAPKK